MADYAINICHSDLIGSTTAVTDDPGAGTPSVVRRRVYTAFGELVEMTGSRVTRYGYAGAWGYQEHDTDGVGGSGDGEADNVLMASPTDGFPFMHLGARYYDPALGRFLQRDPIGLRGGLNVYAYVRNGPTIDIDPDGLRYRPPGATGPNDKGFTDGFWSKVHYTGGWAAGKAGLSFRTTMCLAIKWEEWEPRLWPGFSESKLNQLGDIYVALKGWIDSHF